MKVPNSYNPLETMENLLPIISKHLGFGDEEILRVASGDLSPDVLGRSPLEQMEAICRQLEQRLATPQRTV